MGQFEKVIEDPDGEEETLLDPRERYNGEVEQIMADKRTKFSILGHLFMFVLLVQILALYFKNNYFYTNDTYSYVIALAIPASILIILAAIIIYQKYIVKLYDSHTSVFVNLLLLLVFVSISLIAFVVLISLFFTSPKDKQWLYFSLIPYYIGILLVTVFFIYISPGLLDNLNGIQFHEFLLISLYLIFLFIYAFLYTVIVLQNNASSDSDENGEDKNESKVYDQKDA